MFRVTFYYVDSSGKQINQSLFKDKGLALSFCIQISHCSNVEDVSLDLVEVREISKISLCEELHGSNGAFEVVENAK